MIRWGLSYHLEPLTLEVGRNTGGQTVCRKRGGRTEKELRPALSVGSHFSDYFHLTSSEGCMPEGLLGEGLPYQRDSLSVLWQNCCWTSHISWWNQSLPRNPSSLNAMNRIKREGKLKPWMTFGFRQRGNGRSIYRINLLASKQKGFANSALKGSLTPPKNLFFFLRFNGKGSGDRVKFQSNHMMSWNSNSA